MTVYVDPLIQYPTSVKTPVTFRGKPSCHMVADSREELVEFAVRIGLRPQWLQDEGKRTEHFDLTPRKRQLAVANGAVSINLSQLVEIMRRKGSGLPTVEGTA